MQWASCRAELPWWPAFGWVCSLPLRGTAAQPGYWLPFLRKHSCFLGITVWSWLVHMGPERARGEESAGLDPPGCSCCEIIQTLSCEPPLGPEPSCVLPFLHVWGCVFHLIRSTSFLHFGHPLWFISHRWISFWFFSTVMQLWLFVFSLFKKNYLFIWLRWVSVAARGIFVAMCGIFSCGKRALSCWMQLAPWPGIEPRPPALGAWSLNHWTTREVPVFSLLCGLGIEREGCNVCSVYHLENPKDNEKLFEMNWF